MALFVLLTVCIVKWTTAFAFDPVLPGLTVYPAPTNAVLNKDFTVKVRQKGKAWQSLAVYTVKVSRATAAGHKEEKASMCYFDFTGVVEVAVTYNKGLVQQARVRPLSYSIPPTINGKTVFFQLNRPANLSVEVNGDIFHNLHLFANPVSAFKPDLRDTNLLYFGPGVHEIKGQVLHVSSGKTVYLAGGAILKGQVLISNAHDVRVLGRGMVDQSVKQGVRIANSRNVEVEGIFCTQCFTGGSDSVTIRNVKSMSYYGWGDGMNVISSTNVLLDGVFNRNSDDCTTVYGTRLGFTGSSRNITMQNSTLWADVAHPILIGTHGNTPNPDVLEDLHYINIDILDHKEAQIDYQGCLSIDAGDNNLVRNVLFENIRVEDFRQGQLINIRVFFNKKYCTAPGRGVENVLFKDITYNGQHAELSIISGYNEERKVKNIVFENLKINGRVISDDMEGKPGWYRTADMAHIALGDHVEGVEFRASASLRLNKNQ
ncbi:endo-polygalacturonase [Niastella vici]|uniref:Endo-polygalacturonase n=2 Tax=Niastella vici TaxID=1703345 RepID=A0A1V9FHA1_9BACT|nr:endo-polygalacturonase [Niastella vici]